MTRTWARAALVLAGLGATLGVALDGIHSHFGATRYPSPWVWRMAWWVPLLFGGAFVLGLARPAVERALGRETVAPTWGKALVGMGSFVVAYWLSVAPLPWPAVTGLIVATFVAAWAYVDRTAVGLGFAAVASVGGPAVEAALVSLGKFEHLGVVAFGLPGWLPALYLTASVGLGALAKRLVAPPPAAA